MQKKIKSLLPSLKEKKRYLVFEVDGIKSNFLQEVTKQIKQTIGLFESAKAGIMPVQENQTKGMIRIANTHVDTVKSALLFITNINGKPATARSIGVSGMINKAKTKYM